MCVICITYNISIRAAVFYAPSSVSLSFSLDNAGPVSLSCILLDSGGWGTGEAGCNANSLLLLLLSLVEAQAQARSQKTLVLLFETPRSGLEAFRLACCFSDSSSLFLV